MKSRIFHTKFWTGSYIRKLSVTERLYYFYLITNEYANILHLYELPDDIACLQTGIPTQEIVQIRQKLKADRKIDYVDEWIYLANAEKYAFYKGIKNNHLKLRIMIEMSETVFTYFKDLNEKTIKQIIAETDITGVKDQEFINLLNRVIHRGIDKGMGILPINQKPETRILNSNKKEEKDKKEETIDIEELPETLGN